MIQLDNKERLNLWLSSDLKETLKRLAEKNEMSMNAYIRMLIKQAANQEK